VSLVIPEFVVPSDEMLSIFKEEDLDQDTQPAPFDEDLLERRVAVATMYEHEQRLRYHGPVHIGRVSMVNMVPNIAHLAQREEPEPTDTTFVMPESYHTLIAPDQQKPNYTQNFSVRSLFYILPQRNYPLIVDRLAASIQKAVRS